MTPDDFDTTLEADRGTTEPAMIANVNSRDSRCHAVDDGGETKPASDRDINILYKSVSKRSWIRRRCAVSGQIT